MTSKLKKIEGKKQMANLYFQKLNDLEIKHKIKLIETSFGDTNVIMAGNFNKPSLILVHGFCSCAPFALETILGLEKHFKIYAIDVLGASNLNPNRILKTKTNDYEKWIYEILSFLQVYNAYFMGISLGGYIGLKSLVLNSNRFKKVFLINPVGVVNYKYLNILTQILPLHLFFKLFKKEIYVKKIYEKFFSENEAFTFNFFKTILCYSKFKFISYPLISKQEAISITTPLYFIISEDEAIYSGKKLVEKSKEFFPSIEEVILFEKTKHFLNKKQHQMIVDYILKTIKF